MSGVLPIATLWASKNLIDIINQYFQQQDVLITLNIIILWVMIVTSLIFLGIISQSVNHNISNRLSFLITFDMQKDILQHCVCMDYENYDVPKNQNVIFQAFTQSCSASEQLFTTFSHVINKIITLVLSALALFTFGPWLCFLAIGMAVPNLLLNIRLAQKNYNVNQMRAERVRKTNYLTNFLFYRHSLGIIYYLTLGITF